MFQFLCGAPDQYSGQVAAVLCAATHIGAGDHLLLDGFGQLLTAFAQTQKETERVIFRLGAPAGNGPDPLVGSPVLFSNGFFPELLTLPEGKGGSVLLHKYPTLVHTACIAQPEELADTDTPAALAQLEALVREKG